MTTLIIVEALVAGLVVAAMIAGATVLCALAADLIMGSP